MIILDNTALSSFAHIERLDIPSKLFGKAVIPETVYYEGVIKAEKSERADRIKRSIEEGSIDVSSLQKMISGLQRNCRRTLDQGNDT